MINEHLIHTSWTKACTYYFSYSFCSCNVIFLFFVTFCLSRKQSRTPSMQLMSWMSLRVINWVVLIDLVWLVVNRRNHNSFELISYYIDKSYTYPTKLDINCYDKIKNVRRTAGTTKKENDNDSKNTIILLSKYNIGAYRRL